MKMSRVLTCVVFLTVAVGFSVGADGNTSMPAAPMLGQPGSLLEVYGVIDLATRVATQANAAGDTFFGFSQGLFNGSRWGLRGTEAIVGSLKAIYTLEGGVIVPAGTIDQQGQIFGRQAWVGVSSDYGTLTFGRQYGTFSDAIGAGDVFGAAHGNGVYANSPTAATNYGGNDGVNAFFLSQSGLRWDDSIKYAANFGGIAIGAMAVPGQIFGTNTAGYFPEYSMFAGSIGYSSKDLPVSGMLGAQAEFDLNNDVHSAFGGGLKFAFDPTDAVYAFYFHSTFDKGFVKIQNGDSEFGKFGVADNVTAYGRVDDIANVAVNYYVTPSLNLIASYYFDYAQNVLAAGDNGMRNSFLGVVDYYFTKEFDAYIGASYTAFSSALQTAGFSNQNSAVGGSYTATATNSVSGVFDAMLGARYRF